jgi:hypothetical protein
MADIMAPLSDGERKSLVSLLEKILPAEVAQEAPAPVAAS